MPSDRLFQFGTALSLALACVCVGYAEYDVLPEVAVISAGVIAALGILLRLEGRVDLLSVPAANRLGLFLGGGMLVWGGCRLSWEYHHHEFQNMPWQFMLAAMFGPLLIASIPAKLARREKHAGDYWSLHAMGLVAVCLAGAIAQDWVTLVLMGLYATAACWAVSLLHLRQASGALTAAPVAAMEVESAGSSPPAPLRGQRVVAFLAAAAVFAVPLYLITPPSPADKLSFGKPRIEIGFAADQMTDLHRTGELKVNDAVAFEVTATIDGLPKTDLSVDQRWFGKTFHAYANGQWTTAEQDVPLPRVQPSPVRVTPWRPPDLGPGQCMLSFTVPRDLRAHVLADPIVWAGGQSVPVADRNGSGGLDSWQTSGTGYPFTLLNSPGRSTLPWHYVQAWRPESDPDLGPPFRLVGPNLHKLRYLPDSASGVKEYADRILYDLIRAGRLPANCLDPIRLLPRPAFHDRIALAFSAHLSSTPELTYTTNLKVTHTDIDPVVDFLFHTKSGHCERFASALALMLRSQGIPAVLVLGFKGCEPAGVPGRYMVRQNHAHAWVAALIQEFEPPTPADPRPVSRWRSLDPYPAAAETEARGEPAPVVSWAHRMYLRFFSDVTGENRRRALEELADQAARGETLSAAAVAILLGIGLRVWLRRRRREPAPIPSPHASWFDFLVGELRPFGYSPQAGETPREFAVRISAELGARSFTRFVAEIPTEWVEAYYELRYGDMLIEPPRHTALLERLEGLIRALKVRT